MLAGDYAETLEKSNLSQMALLNGYLAFNIQGYQRGLAKAECGITGGEQILIN